MAETTRNLSSFRGRLFLVITLIVVFVTAIGAAFAQRHLIRVAEEEFLALAEQQANASLQARKVRQAVLAEMCSDLARQPRIHAALEDDALDLLYPSAVNELWQLMREFPVELADETVAKVQARFYRFLDLQGQVIKPVDSDAHGWLPDSVESEIALDKLPLKQEISYITIPDKQAITSIFEVISVPIISMETIQPISALVVGFPYELKEELSSKTNLNFGIRINSQVFVDGLAPDEIDELENEIADFLSSPPQDRVFDVTLAGIDYYVILKPLNEGKSYPLAHGVYLSSLEPLAKRQANLNREIFLISAIILIVGLVSAHFSARKMSRPVKALAQASAEEHDQRVSAELALDNASIELERAARFSADASHQLKTPVAVMRAGLEELMMSESFPSELKDEVRALINQTGRLTRVIEDLLLLSQLDAGSLKINIQPVNLSTIIDGLVDDMSILPESEQLEIEVIMDKQQKILGNRTYTSLIFQSLLENARKYNRPGGRIRINCETDQSFVHCRVGNTGKAIYPEAQSKIFERFHRGSSGENVTGYGLGLNLAMELTRLHGGKLRLIYSEDDWTEFQLSLQLVHAEASF